MKKLSIVIIASTFFCITQPMETTAVICGICKKPGGDIYWPSHHSDYAHFECYDSIASTNGITTTCLLKFMSKKSSDEQKKIFVNLREIVEKQCDPLTISEYLKNHGHDSLNDVFIESACMCFNKPNTKESAALYLHLSQRLFPLGRQKR